MLVNFTPSIGSVNKIAFRKAEQQRVKNHVHPLSCATVNTRTSGTRTPAFYLKGKILIKNMLRASAFVTAFLACEKAELPKPPAGDVKPELQVASEMLGCLFCNDSLKKNSAYSLPFTLDTALFEALDEKGKLSTLGYGYAGQTPQGKHFWRSTNIGSDKSISNIGKRVLESAKEFSDGSSEVVFSDYVSRRKKHNDTNYSRPVKSVYRKQAGCDVIIQNDTVFYYPRTFKEAYKVCAKKTTSIIKKVR